VAVPAVITILVAILLIVAAPTVIGTIYSLLTEGIDNRPLEERKKEEEEEKVAAEIIRKKIEAIERMEERWQQSQYATSNKAVVAEEETSTSYTSDDDNNNNNNRNTNEVEKRNIFSCSTFIWEFRFIIIISPYD